LNASWIVDGHRRGNSASPFQDDLGRAARRDMNQGLGADRLPSFARTGPAFIDR
jgi:hypothetical protein